jgi:hypothetical protein
MYLRDPDMQPKVSRLMAVRADNSGFSFKTIVFLARIEAR